MDLGLARGEKTDQNLTGAQATMGTPGYMSPEQAVSAKESRAVSQNSVLAEQGTC